MSGECIEFTYLSQEDVIAAGGLDMRMAIDAIEKAFRLLNEGKVVVPNKILMDLPPGERERGRMNGLAAYIGGGWEVAGIKWIPGFPSNPVTRNLPRANALIILSDTNSGMPLAVMDGTLLSAMRTGAVGGLGARFLARNDSEVVALIGMGVQARTQAMALAETLPNLREIRGYCRTKEKANKVAEEIHQLTGVRTIVASGPREAVEGADIIDTVTYADEPIVKNSWVKKGSLFIHVGSYLEEEYEVVLQSDKIVVSEREAVKHRKMHPLFRTYNEGLITDDDIYASLDEIVARKKVGRETQEERIFLAPIGMAHEDIAIASMLYERAKAQGIGRKLPLWNRPLWV
jgi:ornithine cyclodeaminase/alanine dehydrogenase-like protein (mu-crystallin family)